MKKINISIDDVSPHPRSSQKVLEQCEKLISEFPDIKFTLFIPIAYWRTFGDTATRKPFYLWEDKELCDVLKNLNDNNFELGYHGFFHGIPGKSNNDEFKTLTKEKAEVKINLMEKGLKKAGLYEKFKKIFRPPAWRISPDAIKAFKNKDFEILALSKQQYALDVYKGEQKNFPKVNYYNLNPPFIPLTVLDEEQLNIVYHACEWDKNYLDMEKVEELSAFLKNIDNKEYIFM
jgi:predicted deacetylase